MTINLKVQTQTLRDKGSSIKRSGTNIAGLHDNLIQIIKELDYHVKQNVSYIIADCLHLLQDNYNLVGEYGRQIMDAAEAYDRREEELHKMFEQLEIETLGIDVKGTQEIEKEQSKQPKAVMATLDRNFTKSPRDLYDDQDKEISKKETSREEIRKILEQIPELQEINYDMFLDNEQVKRIQEYIRSKGYKIMITSKLDSQTKFALVSMGIDISFLQEDSYRGDGLNLYTYLQNNPVNYIDPTGYCAEDTGNQDDVYRAIDLINGMHMYDPNSQVAVYINDVKTISRLTFKPLIDKVYESPTVNNPYPISVGKASIIKDVYDQLETDKNSRKNDTAIKIGVSILDEAQDIYESMQEGVTVGGPNLFSAGVVSVASYLYKKSDDNPEPDYLRDYLYDYWSEDTRKSLIVSTCKTLYIQNSEYKYLVNAGSKDRFINELNRAKNIINEYPLNDFPEITQRNMKYYATEYINRIIYINNNFDETEKILKSRLKRIEQDVMERLK